MSQDPLQIARQAHLRVLAAEAKAKPAREQRDAAVLAAFRAGVKPPTIAAATQMTLSNVRKVLREAAPAVEGA